MTTQVCRVWSRQFDRCRQVSGILNQSEEGQVNMLIYGMGDEAEDILYSFGLSDDDQKKYIVKIFDDHFIPTCNKIFEWARFNR